MRPPKNEHFIEHFHSCLAGIKIDWNKTKCLHKKTFQIPRNWLGATICPSFHSFWYSNMAAMTSYEHPLYRKLHFLSFLDHCSFLSCRLLPGVCRRYPFIQLAGGRLHVVQSRVCCLSNNQKKVFAAQNSFGQRGNSFFKRTYQKKIFFDGGDWHASFNSSSEARSKNISCPLHGCGFNC